MLLSKPTRLRTPRQSPIKAISTFHTELALLLPLLLLNCTIRFPDPRAVSLVARASLRCLIRHRDTSVDPSTNKLVARKATFRTQLSPVLGLVQAAQLWRCTTPATSEHGNGDAANAIPYSGLEVCFQPIYRLPQLTSSIPPPCVLQQVKEHRHLYSILQC